jgi:hypothetical protein
MAGRWELTDEQWEMVEPILRPSRREDIRRWQNYTGEQAVHATSRKRFDEITALKETSHV